MDSISVVVPMHNMQDYVSETLRSLMACAPDSAEIIVVNDRSTDGSVARVRDLVDRRIRIVEGPGRGISACMNAGLAHASGSIIMRCDADDLYPINRIKRQLEWLRLHPDFDAVCGAFSTIDIKGNPVADMQCGTIPEETTHELRQGKVRTHLNTYAIRAELLRKAGEFREFFEMGGDIDMQLRLGESGRIGYIPDNFYFWRLHNSSIVHSRSSTQREFFENMAYAFQAQRLSTGADDLQRGTPPAKPVAGMLSPPSTATDHVQSLLLGSAWKEYEQGNRLEGLRFAARAIVANPTKLHAWNNTLTLLIKSVTGRSAKR